MPRNDALWTDYDGDEPYVDHLVNAVDGQPVNQRRYLPGLGHVDDITGTTAYVHGDQVGTLRLLTDGVTGATLLRRVFSAFGEQALSEGTGASRYGYAGAFGYESFGFADLPFIHVGERWYDPSSGRFLQRDPIGIDDGPNPYAYVHSQPVQAVDPRGLWCEWSVKYNPDAAQYYDPNRSTGPPSTFEQFLMCMTGIAYAAPLVVMTAPVVAPVVVSPAGREVAKWAIAGIVGNAAYDAVKDGCNYVQTVAPPPVAWPGPPYK